MSSVCVKDTRHGLEQPGAGLTDAFVPEAGAGSHTIFDLSSFKLETLHRLVDYDIEGYRAMSIALLPAVRAPLCGQCTLMSACHEHPAHAT